MTDPVRNLTTRFATAGTAAACLIVALMWPEWRQLARAQGYEPEKIQLAFLFCNALREDLPQQEDVSEPVERLEDCRTVKSSLINRWSFVDGQIDGKPMITVFDDQHDDPPGTRQVTVPNIVNTLGEFGLLTTLERICFFRPEVKVNVFIYVAGHGVPGAYVTTDKGKLTAEKFLSLITPILAKPCLEDLVVAVDHCFSGSMAPAQDALAGIPNSNKLVFGFSTSKNWLAGGHLAFDRFLHSWTAVVFHGMLMNQPDLPERGGDGMNGVSVEEAFRYGKKVQQISLEHEALLRLRGRIDEKVVRGRPDFVDGDPGRETILDPPLPDKDGDGVADVADNCVATPNPNQADLDGDTLGDACDPDDDLDGWMDTIDNCPSTPNLDENDHQRDLDKDGLGDVCDPDSDGDGLLNGSDADDDNDGVPDVADNCALAPNPGQGDADQDGSGDACSIDDDADGFEDAVEREFGSNPVQKVSVPEFAGLGVSCTDGVDNDLDGRSDALDPSCIDADADFVPDLLDNCPSVPNHQWDHDRDGLGDECDIEGTNPFVAFQVRTATQKTTTSTAGCPTGFVGTFSFDGRLTARPTSPALWTLQTKVRTLTNGNLLQNADGGPGGVGAVLTVPQLGGFSDGVLAPGEFVDVPFKICLKRRTSFTFVVDALGTVLPANGQLASVARPAGPDRGLVVRVNAADLRRVRPATVAEAKNQEPPGVLARKVVK
jgi:hypothetical protein